MSNLPPDSAPDWSDEELLLLRSAKDDRPPSESLAATLAAVGVGTAVVSTATAAQAAMAAAGKGAGTSAASWVGAVGASKWLSIVAVAGAITAGGIALERRASSTKQAQPPTQSRRPRDHALLAPVVREQAAASSTDPAPAVAAPPQAIAVSVAQPARASSSRRKETSAQQSAPSQPDLTREIASIDAARVALRRGAASEAIQALDRYDAEYANAGSLTLEATALRIEALYSQGDRVPARKLARTFLIRHPKNPYAAAIRKLVASDQGAR